MATRLALRLESEGVSRTESIVASSWGSAQTLRLVSAMRAALIRTVMLTPGEPRASVELSLGTLRFSFDTDGETVDVSDTVSGARTLLHDRCRRLVLDGAPAAAMFSVLPEGPATATIRGPSGQTRRLHLHFSLRSMKGRPRHEERLLVCL